MSVFKFQWALKIKPRMKFFCPLHHFLIVAKRQSEHFRCGKRGQAKKLKTFRLRCVSFFLFHRLTLFLPQVPDEILAIASAASLSESW